MFRGTGESEMDDRHFGVGSTIEKKYLVVKTGVDCHGPYVGLLDLRTFVVGSKSVCVEDIHYLSKNEFEKVLALIKDEPYTNWCTSDFEVQVKGMKP